ncbi:SGNH hydrolase-type esterase domain-containing protein [Pestalotiopsis sp. NC0098]|nr:SGNH hydrolase-type esterase domain-containing protein [Pestalotiopsis sp. NC0098]
MTLHIVNIGSSFAAGPGLPPQVDQDAARSGENYASIAARAVGAKLTDLSVSGATLLNLLSEPQTSLRGKTFAPQISEIPGDADVVLVLGGGNDIRYIGGLFMDSFAAYTAYRVAAGLYSWVAGGAEEPLPNMTVGELAERYGTVLDAIHAKAPNAQVIVVEYLTMLGPDVRPGVDVPVDPSLLDGHRARCVRVQEATAQAVRGREAWCVRIPVASESTGHGLGSAAPWVNGFGLRELYNKFAYHPNAEGMKAVAAMVVQQMKELGIASTPSQEA